MSEEQTNLHVRIEPEVKEEAESILTSLLILANCRKKNLIKN